LKLLISSSRELDTTSMPTATIIEYGGVEHRIECEIGKSIMQIALDIGVPGILADCGGCVGGPDAGKGFEPLDLPTHHGGGTRRYSGVLAIEPTLGSNESDIDCRRRP
jgi:hypothetical protein